MIAKVRNEKAKRFLANMREKQAISFTKHFHSADPKALALLKRMLSFDPQQRPSAVEALRDPYFHGALLLRSIVICWHVREHPVTCNFCVVVVEAARCDHIMRRD